MRYGRLCSLLASAVVLVALGTVVYRAYERTYRLNPALERALADAGQRIHPGDRQAADRGAVVARVGRVLERGADVTVRNQRILGTQQRLGYGTALELCTREGDFSMVKRLLDRGALVDAPGMAGRPLYWAVCRRDVELVQAPVAGGARVDVRVAPGHYLVLPVVRHRS